MNPLPPTLDQLLKLSPEELRVKCAAIHGFERMRLEWCYKEMKTLRHKVPCTDKGIDVIWCKDGRDVIQIPAYSTSLDAIHLVELSLSEPMKAELDDLLYDNGGYSATAHQRCACVVYLKGMYKPKG